MSACEIACEEKTYPELALYLARHLLTSLILAGYFICLGLGVAVKRRWMVWMSSHANAGYNCLKSFDMKFKGIPPVLSS